MRPFSSNHYQRWSKIPYPKETTKPLFDVQHHWPLLFFKKYENMSVITKDNQTVKLQIKDPREINFYTELTTLQDMIEQDDTTSFHHTIDPLTMWDSLLQSLSPTYSSIIMSRINGLLAAALHDVSILSAHLKAHWDVARPIQLNPTLRINHDTPRTPAYPSEFAITCGMIEEMLLQLFPTEKNRIREFSNQQLSHYQHSGLNFSASIREGHKLGTQLGEMVVHSHPILPSTHVQMRKTTTKLKIKKSK